MTDDETLFEIKKILAGLADVEPEEITLSSRLWEDLGLDGDEWDEVFEAFLQRFDVDMSEFRWYHHHGLEGFNPLWLVVRPWWMKVPKIPVTVGDLVQSAKTGRWCIEYPFEPVRPRPDIAGWIMGILLSLLFLLVLAAQIANWLGIAPE